MRILITGGAGYLGCSLIEELLNVESIEDIVVYDNLQTNNYNFFTNVKFKDSRLRFIKGDILDNRKLSDSLRDIDVVYHLAAKVNEPESDVDSHFYDQINNIGTGVVINEAIKRGVKKLFYMSSIHVYGYSESIQTINSETLPKSFYGISKLRGEKQAMTLPVEMDVCVFRIGNVFGFNHCLRYDTLLNRLFFEANVYNKIMIYGDGEQFRPFISVKYLGEKLVHSLFQESCIGLQNAVQMNISLNEIRNILRKIFPELEYNYVNRHISLGSIKVSDTTKYKTNTTPKDILLKEFSLLKEKMI